MNPLLLLPIQLHCMHLMLLLLLLLIQLHCLHLMLLLLPIQLHCMHLMLLLIQLHCNIVPFNLSRKTSTHCD